MGFESQTRQMKSDYFEAVSVPPQFKYATLDNKEQFIIKTRLTAVEVILTFMDMNALRFHLQLPSVKRIKSHLSKFTRQDNNRTELCLTLEGCQDTKLCYRQNVKSIKKLRRLLEYIQF